jgi:hypothetical protein
LAGVVSELKAILVAGCEAAIAVRGIARGIGTACFAMRAGGADFDLSAVVSFAGPTAASVEGLANCLDAVDADKIWRDQAI